MNYFQIKCYLYIKHTLTNNYPKSKINQNQSRNLVWSKIEQIEPQAEWKQESLLSNFLYGVLTILI